MRGIPVLMALLAMLLAGKAETLAEAKDYAVGSDVVLESVVEEVKSVPPDAVGVAADVVEYFEDETMVPVKAVKNAFKATPREKIAREGIQEIDDAWDTSGDLVFRSYEVGKEMGDLLASAGRSGEDVSIDVSGFFTGIGFDGETSAYYMPNHGCLLVCQTMENILAIEDRLREYGGTYEELLGHQVEIETKFVEINQSSLNELGFKWQFDGKSGGAADILGELVFPGGQDILADGLRTSASAINSGVGSGGLLVQKTAGSLRWTMLINALDQLDDADVLSAPSIVTRDGSAATIEVGEESMRPNSFEAMTKGTSVFVQHDGWKAVLAGVRLEVTPELRDGGLIDLELKPRILDLVGIDTYQVTPTGPGKYADVPSGGGQNLRTENGFVLMKGGYGYNAFSSNYGNTFDVNPQTARLPYYRLREMETKVTVADGSTIGMGGLVYEKLETFEDKVPLLGSIPYVGRLFRSEGERSVKRNLMIFVTATQVDLNGRRTVDLSSRNTAKADLAKNK